MRMAARFCTLMAAPVIVSQLEIDNAGHNISIYTWHTSTYNITYTRTWYYATVEIEMILAKCITTQPSTFMCLCLNCVMRAYVIGHWMIFVNMAWVDIHNAQIQRKIDYRTFGYICFSNIMKYTWSCAVKALIWPNWYGYAISCYFVIRRENQALFAGMRCGECVYVCVGASSHHQLPGAIVYYIYFLHRPHIEYKDARME